MTSSKQPSKFLASKSRIAQLACVCLALLLAEPVQARGTIEGEARIADCIRQAAESKPWLERTLWGLRDQEAGWIGAEVPNTNGSHDLGPLQVNTWWVPKIAALLKRPEADVRIWLMHDACFNVGAARWIFLSALRGTGDFWQAVGVYHSPTAWRQRRYAISVANHMQRRFGLDVFSTTVKRVSADSSQGRTSATDAVGSSVDTATPRARLEVKVDGFGKEIDPQI